MHVTVKGDELQETEASHRVRRRRHLEDARVEDEVLGLGPGGFARARLISRSRVWTRSLLAQAGFSQVI